MSSSLDPQNEVVVPVAVPLSSIATVDDCDTPHAAVRPSLSSADRKSMYSLPSSRRGFARVPEEVRIHIQNHSSYCVSQHLNLCR